MSHTAHNPTPAARRQLLAAAGLLAVLSAWTAPVAAQDSYPSRPISLVVPFPPGGSADTVSRLVGKRLQELLGQPVVIDNRPGAGTAVGAAFAAKAAADGHTLLVSSGSTFTVNPALRPNLPYDAVKSFDPIGIVGRIPLIVLANKNQPASNVKGFVAAIKAAPGQLTYASFGSGTTSHFTAEIVLQAVGGQMMHVPYKGSAPAMTDLIGGQVAYSVDTVTAALPQLKAGKIKAIAVTTAKRSSQLPDVPTFAESGYPEIDADTWIMMVAPKGTPDAVRAKLEKTLATIVAEPATQAALRSIARLGATSAARLGAG
jgi:tripartite-type tricarboxylate transporter receptor subunit TctC